MLWSLRHRRSRLRVSVTDLASNARLAFLILMRSNRFLILVGVVTGLALGDLCSGGPAPETPKNPVSTKYQDVTVEDPYQWLEKDNDAQVKSWSDAQNQRTRQYLDKLADRAAIEKQLTEWYAKTSPSYSSLVSRPGLLFAMKFQPPKQQPLLVTLTSADDLKSEKVVLDPNVLDTLSLAYYLNGERRRAIETEERAIALASDQHGRAAMVAQLERFRTGRHKNEASRSAR